MYKKDAPYFALYDASVQLLQFRAGVGVRIPWEPLSFITVGGALQVLGSVRGFVGFYSPIQKGGPEGPADPDSRLEAWMDIEVPTSTFYVVGAQAQLTPELRVGIAWRSAQSLEIQLPITLTARLAVNDGFQVSIPVDGEARFTTKHQPQQVSVGASYQLGKLLLTGDLTWVDYSDFKIPFARVTLNIERLKKDPGLKILLGEDSELLDPREPDVEWSDMVVPRLGAEYQVLSWLTARGGYYYENSPLVSTDLPVYDCDKHAWTFGARASFLRPWDLIPGRVNADLALQEMYYVGRTILGSAVGGHVFSFSAGLEVTFL
jgi:hypothetical protein